MCGCSKRLSSCNLKESFPISFVWFFPPRLYRTQVKMLSIRKIVWLHFDLAILYKAVVPLREDPSVPSMVSFTHYATPLWAKKNGASPSRRTAYQSGHAHRDSAIAESVPSSNERVMTPAHLVRSKLVDLLRYEQTDESNKDTECPSSKERVGTPARLRTCKRSKTA